MKHPHRLAVLATTTALAAGIAILVAPTGASAHGAMMSPGSRTYLCWLDGLTANGAIQPTNPACAAAIANSGPTPLYNWFAVLRSDGGGRMSGFIPDGKLCSAAATVYDFSGFDLARDDWPVTHLTAGADFSWQYSNWAQHPGTFSLYVTKDTWSPTRTLAWSDLESTPFLTVTNPAAVGSPGTVDGHYYWSGRLPSGKTGRQIIYSVWARSDSQETFYGCSDVTFDGGNGEVTGIRSGSTPPTSTPPATTTPPATSASPTRPPTTSTRPPTTSTRPPTTSAQPSTTTPRTSSATATTSPAGGTGQCTAAYRLVNSWPGGFQAEVTVSNGGSATLGGWTVRWTVPSGQTVSQVWNGTLTVSGTSASVKNVSWNGSVGANASTTFGMLVNGSSTAAPAVTCTSP